MSLVENSGKILLRKNAPLPGGSSKRTPTQLLWTLQAEARTSGKLSGGDLTRQDRHLQTPEVKAGMISGFGGPPETDINLQKHRENLSFGGMTGYDWFRVREFFPMAADL